MAAVGGGLALGKCFEPGGVLGRELLRQHDLNFGEEVARSLARNFDAVATDAQFGAAGGAGRHAEADDTFRSRDVDLCAQGGLGEADREADKQVISLAGEPFVGSDVDGEQKIAGRAATATWLASTAELLARTVDPDQLAM